ncbi:hypothetical protein B5S31_g4138 [[Candida] boidinii]|nr:hypothetical protein B5S31_g4138 [[Candida] boidinii]OWB78670.1 hypothetical protein B5S32_g2870 [[Candida] boidinii]
MSSIRGGAEALSNEELLGLTQRPTNSNSNSSNYNYNYNYQTSTNTDVSNLDSLRSLEQQQEIDVNNNLKQRRKLQVLTDEILISKRGLPNLKKQLNKFKFNKKPKKLSSYEKYKSLEYGNDYNYENLTKLLYTYQLWGHNILPKAKFKNFINSINRSVNKPLVRQYIRQLIEDEIDSKMNNGIDVTGNDVDNHDHQQDDQQNDDDSVHIDPPSDSLFISSVQPEEEKEDEGEELYTKALEKEPNSKNSEGLFDFITSGITTTTETTEITTDQDKGIDKATLDEGEVEAFEIKKNESILGFELNTKDIKLAKEIEKNQKLSKLKQRQIESELIKKIEFEKQNDLLILKQFKSNDINNNNNNITDNDNTLSSSKIYPQSQPIVSSQLPNDSLIDFMSSEEEEEEEDEEDKGNKGFKKSVPTVIEEEDEGEDDFSDDDELEDIANSTITKSQVPKNDNNGNDYDDDFEAMKEMGF